MRCLALATLALAGCDLVLSLEDPTPIDAPPLPDAADPPAPFNTPVLIAELSTPTAEEDGPSLTDDLLELYYFSNGVIYVSTRPAPDAPWGPPSVVPGIDTGVIEQRPRIAGNGLSMYFARGTHTLGFQTFYTTRASRAASWTNPVAVASINAPGMSTIPGWASPDGLTLLYDSYPINNQEASDIYLAVRANPGEPFTSTPLTALNSESRDAAAWASADGNTILFASKRDGRTELWEAVRRGAEWALFERDELNSQGDTTTTTPWISGDANLIVFESNRLLDTQDAKEDNLYIATRSR